MILDNKKLKFLYQYILSNNIIQYYELLFKFLNLIICST